MQKWDGFMLNLDSCGGAQCQKWQELFALDTEVGRYEAFVIQIIFQTEENTGPNWIMSHYHYRSKPPKVTLPKPMEVDTVPIFFNIFDGLSIE